MKSISTKSISLLDGCRDEHWHQRNEYIHTLLCARRGRPVERPGERPADGRRRVRARRADGVWPSGRAATGGGTDGGTAPVGEQGEALAHAHVKAQKRKRRRAPQNVSVSVSRPRGAGMAACFACPVRAWEEVGGSLGGRRREGARGEREFCLPHKINKK